MPSLPGAFAAGGLPRVDGFAAGGAIGLEVGGGGIAIAGEEIEEGEAAGDCAGASGVAIAQGGEEFGVCVARAGVAVAIEKFRIRGPCGYAIGIGLGGAGERGARTRGIAGRL